MEQETTLNQVFDQNGILGQDWDGYQMRSSQLEMAQTVKDAIDLKLFAIIEAPTGLGKSFAYLVPALLSGKRVIVATANKNLQNQLADKDMPQLMQMLQIDGGFAVAKGMSNYLCHWKWHKFQEQVQAQGLRRDIYLEDAVSDIKEKMQSDDFEGDVEYLDHDIPYPERNQIVSLGHDCIGERCEFFAHDCYVMKMRRKASESRVVITNHHLLLLSLSRPMASLLPAADVYIVDEAHNLESAATMVFQKSITSYTLPQLLNNSVYKESLGDFIVDLEEHNAELFDYLDHNTPVNEPLTERLGAFADMSELLGTAVKGIKDQLSQTSWVGQSSTHEVQMEKASQVLQELSQDCKNMSMEDEDYVRYKRGRTRSDIVEFCRDPIRPGPYIRKMLFAEGKSVICTSATLTTNGGFGHFRRQCNLSADAVVELKLPFIFDYEAQAFLYQPAMPKYRYDKADEYYVKAANCIHDIVDITDGNVLCLFTSWRGLNRVFELLQHNIVFPLRRQESHVSKRELLHWFQNTNHSVLCATRSFWEGVDVPGDALTAVVLDKLPFPNPKDPVHGRRMQVMDATKGVNSFAGYTLPHMALTLKQGFGRLIRSETGGRGGCIGYASRSDRIWAQVAETRFAACTLFKTLARYGSFYEPRHRKDAHVWSGGGMG